MNTIQAVVLILSAAFAWIGLTVVTLLKLRRRRRGSSVVAAAPDPPEPTTYRPHMPWRRSRPAAGQGRRRLRVKKVRG